MTENIREDQFFRYNPDEFDHTIDGVPVTNELLNDLDDALCAPVAKMSKKADKVLAKHRRRNTAGLRKGGVSLSIDGSNSPALKVVLPRDLYDQVQANAASAGMSASKYARRLIAAAIAS